MHNSRSTGCAAAAEQVPLGAHSGKPSGTPAAWAEVRPTSERVVPVQARRRHSVPVQSALQDLSVTGWRGLSVGRILVAEASRENPPVGGHMVLAHENCHTPELPRDQNSIESMRHPQRAPQGGLHPTLDEPVDEPADRQDPVQQLALAPAGSEPDSIPEPPFAAHTEPEQHNMPATLPQS